MFRVGYWVFRKDTTHFQQQKKRFDLQINGVTFWMQWPCVRINAGAR
jgi:hypothetical protein